MTFSDQTIRDRLLLTRLPALPQTLLKLMRMCQSDAVGMNELTELIATEPALSARLLAVANSAAYHHGDARLGLLQAANTLGTRMIKMLVISESVLQACKAFTAAGSFDLRYFWKHSLSAALLAQDLAERCDYAQPDDAYLAGLLHDIGRLALLACAPHACQAHFFAADDAPLCDAEQQALNISHAEAGAWLMEHWGLAPALVEAVLHHHAAPDSVATRHPLTRIVHLTHLLQEWAASGSTQAPDLDRSARFDSTTLLQVLASAELRVVQMAADLGLDISTATQPVPPPTAAPVREPALEQLAQEVRNRSLLTEMSLQLAQHDSVATLLTSVRQHAGLLLGLDEALVLLQAQDRQALDCVSAPDRHSNMLALSLDPLQHPVLHACLQRQTAAFSEPSTQGDAELCQLLDSTHVLALPLVTAKQVLGLLLAALPARQLPAAQSQSSLLQAFGQHAGAALSQHLQAARALDARIASIKHEQLISARQLVHEVSNPITIIQNYLGIIDEKIASQQAVKQELSLVGGEISRLGNLVERFTEGAEAPVLQAIELEPLVRELVQLLRLSRYFPASIDIQCNWPHDSSLVLGSPDLLKQILINLIKNARESIPHGGHIIVSGGQRVQHRGRSCITLCVSDDGPGLDARVQAGLFRPVVSHKGGKYHGLGLSVVHRLVQQMDGAISYRNEAPGLTFEVLLPCPA